MTLFENKTPASRLHFQLLKLLLLSVFVSASAIAAPVPTVTVTELQDGLDHPWSLAFLPDNGGDFDHRTFRATSVMATGKTAVRTLKRRACGVC
uniref:Uncharacterized protein n=1 Tax=Yersinia enterocolitica W22703 TaxID=913028 RepID=F4N415_YEREN|nr:unknown protein [Yersinia enterocolitica W22703]